MDGWMEILAEAAALISFSQDIGIHVKLKNSERKRKQATMSTMIVIFPSAVLLVLWLTV